MSDDENEDLETGGSLDIRKIAWAILCKWKVVLICTVVAVLFEIFSLHHAVYIYSAQMQVTPPQNSGDDSGSSRLGALGGLASLANIALPGAQNASQFRLFVDSLKSRDLADELAKNQPLMEKLFSYEWDEATHTWYEPPRGMFYGPKVWLRSLLGLAPLQSWHPPDGSDMQLFLGQNLSVEENTAKAYLVRISFSSSDRKFAVDFLGLLTKTADNLLRQKALLRTRQYINYLTDQLNTVTVAEHRLALASTLSEQEKFAMVAKSGAPFAAEVFEKPWASALANSPQPSRMLLTSLFVGALFGSALAYGLAIFGEAVLRWLTEKGWAAKLPGFIRRQLEA